MYESHFQFASRPFSAAPLTDTYFPAETIEAARQTLVRTIDRAEGVGLAVGPAGVGKSLLCRLLAAKFEQSFNVAMLSSARVVTRKSLLQNILFELGLEYRGLEEGELRLSLLDFLQPNDHCPNGMLLIVDEAHSLGLRLLEEVRMITNLVRDGQPRVRLVLAGGAKLEERFTSPKLASFNQRITARCYLDSFTRDETSEYVRTRLVAAGSSRDAIFSADALQAIHQASDGIPRLVNQICDHSLVMAFAGGKHAIDAAGIQEAWADLQQLPGPWQNAPSETGEATVVEFGSLDDEASETTRWEPESKPSADFDSSEPLVNSFTVEDTSIVITQLTSEANVVEDITSHEPAEVAHFEEARDPFAEAFEEEVVVIDRSTVRDSALTGRPRVHSVEGQELATALQNVEPRCLNDEGPAFEPEADVSSAASTTDVLYPAAVETLAQPPASGPSEPDDDDPAQVGSSPSMLAEPEEDTIEGEIEEPVATCVADDEPAACSSEMFEYNVFEANNIADLALQALCDVNIAMGDLEPEQEEPEQESLTVRLADDNDPLVDDSSIIVVEADESQRSPQRETPPVAPRPSEHQVGYQDLFAQLRHG